MMLFKVELTTAATMERREAIVRALEQAKTVLAALA